MLIYFFSISELSIDVVAQKPLTYDEDESRDTVWTGSCFFDCRRLCVFVVVVGCVVEDFCDCFFCCCWLVVLRLDRDEGCFCCLSDDELSSCPLVVVIGGILLLRVVVVVDCTSEFDEDNPSEWFSLDERFVTVQNDDDCVWELFTVELFDNEFEL